MSIIKQDTLERLYHQRELRRQFSYKRVLRFTECDGVNINNNNNNSFNESDNIMTTFSFSYCEILFIDNCSQLFIELWLNLNKFPSVHSIYFNNEKGWNESIYKRFKPNIWYITRSNMNQNSSSSNSNSNIISDSNLKLSINESSILISLEKYESSLDHYRVAFDPSKRLESNQDRNESSKGKNIKFGIEIGNKSKKPNQSKSNRVENQEEEDEREKLEEIENQLQLLLVEQERTKHEEDEDEDEEKYQENNKSKKDGLVERNKRKTNRQTQNLSILHNANSQLQDTVDIGAQILNDLEEQNRQIQNIQSNQKEVDNNLTFSNKILNRMSKWWRG